MRLRDLLSSGVASHLQHKIQEQLTVLALVFRAIAYLLFCANIRLKQIQEPAQLSTAINYPTVFLKQREPLGYQ